MEHEIIKGLRYEDIHTKEVIVIYWFDYGHTITRYVCTPYFLNELTKFILGRSVKYDYISRMHHFCGDNIATLRILCHIIIL